MEAEDWIQESLARLEALEEERSTIETALEEAEDAKEMRRLSQRAEALDKEIKGLYAALEAAAEGGDDGEAPPDDDAATGLFNREDLARMAASSSDPAAAAAFMDARVAGSKPAAAPAPARAATPVPKPIPAAAPAPTPQAVAQPPAGFGGPPAGFGGPPAGFGGPQAGFGGPPAGFGGAEPGFPAPPQAAAFGAPPAPASDFSSGGYADLDEPGGKSKMPLIAVIVGLLVVGVGGYMILGNKTEEVPADDGSKGPAKVFKAGELPPDTQGPKTAKGADVDSVEGSRFKEGRPSSGGGTSRPSSSGSTTKEKKKDNSKTKIINTDDPLAGIDGK